MISLSIPRTLFDPGSEVERVTGISIPDSDDVPSARLLRSVDYYEDAVFNYHLLGEVLSEVDDWLTYERERADPTADFVAPRPPLSLGRFADDTFYDVIPASAGELEVPAEVSVSGRTLTLSDMAVYGANVDLVNEVGGPALVGIRSPLATEAADAGFDTLRPIRVRVSTSSSANTGHAIDRVIDLERFRR